MLRLTGGILIVVGCTGLGCLYRQNLCAGLKHLRYMQQILEMFISEIRYDKATLPECCKRIGNRCKEPYKQAFLHIYEEVKQGEGIPFYVKWREHTTVALADLPLSKEEKRIFSELMDNNGLTDNLMQIKVLEQYRDMILIHIKNREDNLEKQCKMASSLGVMSGLLLAVLLI